MGLKIGDIAIDVYGNIGAVYAICECDRCKERGYFEPRVRFQTRDEYITNSEMETGFRNWYRLGSCVWPEHVNIEDLRRVCSNKGKEIGKLYEEIRLAEGLIDEIEGMDAY